MSQKRLMIAKKELTETLKVLQSFSEDIPTDVEELKDNVQFLITIRNQMQQGANVAQYMIGLLDGKE